MFLAIGGTNVDLIEGGTNVGGTNVGGTNVGGTNVGGRKVAASFRSCADFSNFHPSIKFAKRILNFFTLMSFTMMINDFFKT